MNRNLVLNRERIRKLLYQIRIQSGLTQKEVADRLNKPQSFISKYESGERLLDLAEINEVCKVLGIKLTDFIQKFEEYA